VKPRLAAGGLAISQIALFALMSATSETSDGDPFDSPLYWWTWLLWPACALVAAAVFPDTPASLWTAALCLPLAIGVALLGTIWHDPDDGASLWIAGEVFVGIQALVTHIAALLGSKMRRRADAA